MKMRYPKNWNKLWVQQPSFRKNSMETKGIGNKLIKIAILGPVCINHIALKLDMNAVYFVRRILLNKKDRKTNMHNRQ